jgi:RNA polymerase sigma-70 factor, ECF subfamily
VNHPGFKPFVALAALKVEDLYLACACLAGHVRALEAFETRLWPEAARGLSRVGIEPELCEEVFSKLREALFFGKPPNAPPMIAAYRGRGTLRSWLRSVSIHQALKFRRRARPLVSMDQLAQKLHADGDDPEMGHLRGLYLREFRGALERAMRALSKRERTLLRQHYLDRMSLEAVAKAYRVHRATAARWIADARAKVLARTRNELVEAMKLRPSELQLVLSFMRRQSDFGSHLSGIGNALRRI